MNTLILIHARGNSRRRESALATGKQQPAFQQLVTEHVQMWERIHRVMSLVKEHLTKAQRTQGNACVAQRVSTRGLGASSDTHCHLQIPGFVAGSLYCHIKGRLGHLQGASAGTSTRVKDIPLQSIEEMDGATAPGNGAGIDQFSHSARR